MAHGLFLSNDDTFKDLSKLDATIKFFRDNNVTLEGAVVSPYQVSDQYQFTMDYGNIKTLTDLHDAYPGMKWIYPFSPLVPSSYSTDSLEK